MKTYFKKFIPVVLAAAVIVSPIALYATVDDFGGNFASVASAAEAGDLVVRNFGDGTCWINGFSKTGDVDKTGELVIPDTIHDMTVTGINKNAFANCTELTKVVIPETVTTIEQSAFESCAGLEEIILPDSVTSIGSSAFKNCTTLKKVVMSDNVTSIGGSAFYGCTSLTDITISKNLTSIGSGIFTNTPYYKDEANWDNGILYWGTYLVATKKSVSGEVVIKDGTTLMIGSAFSGNTAITKVTIPGSLSVVSASAFYNCSALTEVVLSEGVKELGKNAFWSCPKLVKLTVPASMEKFTSGAFGNTRVKELNYTGTVDQWVSIKFDSPTDNPLASAHTLYINGEALTEAVISVPVVNAYAFYDCDSLEKVTFTDSVVEIQKDAFEYCSYLTEVNFGKSIKKIDYLAFGNCSRIEKVNTTATVDEWAQIDFYDWRSNPITYSGSLYINGELLEEVVFSNVSIIMPYTFNYCSSIKSISIPGTVIGVANDAFSYCTGLTTIEIEAGPIAFLEGAFAGATNLNYVNYNGTLEQWMAIDFENAEANPVYYAKCLYINGELLEEVDLTGAETVKAFTFVNCASIKELYIPGTVKVINNAAFQGTSIEELVIHEGTTAIGGLAFSECQSLKTVYIADGVETIGSSAFAKCSNLESVDLPKSITTYSHEEFLLCTNLKKVNYRGTIDEWASITFWSDTSNPVYYSRCLYLNDVLLEDAVIKEVPTIKARTFINCDSIKTLVVGGNTKTINGAFEGCNGLTYVEIQESVTNISTNAFLYCTALVEVNISEEGGALALGGQAFFGCSALEEIVLPNRVSRINNATFKNCTSLKIVYLSADLTKIAYDAFYNCPSLEMVYYESSAETYAKINVEYGNEALKSAETHYNVSSIDDHYTIVTVPATCTEDGSITKSCPCGYSSFTIIHASNHKPVLTNQKDPTCTTDGYTGDTICEACKEVFEHGSTIAACGHSGGTATCENPAKCEKCSEYYGDVLPHTYSSETDSICDVCGFDRQLNIPQGPVQDENQNNDQNNATPDNNQDNSQNSNQDNTQNNNQNNNPSTVPGNTQDDTPNNKEDNKKPIESTAPDSTQNDANNDTESTVQDNTQNNASGDNQSTGQDNVETTNTRKPYIALVGFAVITTAFIISLVVVKKKQKIAK